jgi:tryptophan synthase alpha chain
MCGDLSARIGVPLVAMSYINPILAYGVERFARDAAAAGICGAILPDVSFEESTGLRSPLRSAGLEYVDMLAPTSSDERIDAIAGDASGFLYLVSMTGVTGARGGVPDSLPGFVARTRVRAPCPLYVGFGVSTPAQAAGVVRHADGVIIGSQLIRLIDRKEMSHSAARVGDFIAGVRTAIDGGEKH